MMPREADLEIHRHPEGIFKAALFSLKGDKDPRQLEKYIGPNDADVGRCSRARCRGKATGYEGHEAVVKPLLHDGFAYIEGDISECGPGFGRRGRLLGMNT